MSNFGNLDSKFQVGKGGQLEINLDSLEIKDDFGGFASEQERIDTAREYKVMGDDAVKEFIKKDGKVYHQKGDNELIPIEEWFKQQEELYGGNDNSEAFNPDKYKH